ncbi:MAG: hypothetical protein PHU23_02190 [Dehalococcoidales bacterium]|nr:hypothetical protein [Dehalococcoidales bacterium]
MVTEIKKGARSGAESVLADNAQPGSGPANNIVSRGPLTREALDSIIKKLKYGREVIGAYGESAGVTCPHCGCRQYPDREAVAKCLSCGLLYRVPEGYRSPKAKRNEFLNRILLKAHRDAGLYLEEDDHALILFHEGNEVSRFTLHATIENVLHEADQWLNMQKSGISFEESPGVVLVCSCGWQGDTAPIKAVFTRRHEPDEKEPVCPSCGKPIAEYKED